MPKNFGGSAAYSGLIFQALYAIVVSMKDDKWSAIKVEPLTSTGKTDIALYDLDDGVNIHLLNNGSTNCYKKIQVKKRTSSVSNKQIRAWCEELINDDPADHYELCLFGTTTSEISREISNEYGDNVKVLNNNIGDVIKRVKEDIAEYFQKNEVEDYADEDLDAAYYALFYIVCLNSQQQKAITKENLNGLLKNILDRSPFNTAAKIKHKSYSVFYESKEFSRDLRTSRLDESGSHVIEENLTEEDFPLLESETFEKSRYNLFDYFLKHAKDKSTERHIFISGASGSGKTTYLYGIWKECLRDYYLIPIYVPLYDVKSSIKEYVTEQYFSHAAVKEFDWTKNAFCKTPYHIVILLDGFNELAENAEESNETLKHEIDEILNIDKITVIITSRNPSLKLHTKITRFKMCPLSNDQIKRFLGGNDEFLETAWYKGLLDNPFMLEIIIKTFSDEREKISSVAQASLGMILKKYFDKQTGRNSQKKQAKSIELSVANRIIVDVLLPLIAAELDKKDERAEIREDAKLINWDVFIQAVNSSYSIIEYFANSIEFCIGSIDNYSSERYGYGDFVEIIKELQRRGVLAVSLFNTGRKLEIFSDKSRRGKAVIWDHEIYRDYFTARGYALFSANSKTAIETRVRYLINLGNQINYRYPEPGFKYTNVSSTIRQYHVRKAQMFVDIVDSMLTDDSEFDNDSIKEIKTTAAYRRLVRDIALIYEDLKDNKMISAADLGLTYYESDLNAYDHIMEYDKDYEQVERRYADAAYSISSLAYNFTHDRIRIKKKGEDKQYDKKYDEESKTYLEKAGNALRIADSIFGKLSDEIKKNRTVQDDILKCKGNMAAYYIGMYKITGNKDYLDKAKAIHKNNKQERLKILKLLENEGDNLTEIKNDTASSYNGIATCYFYLGEYKTAIKYQNEAAAIRPENNYNGKCLAYRNIIGCYAKLNSYSKDEVRQVLDRVYSTLNLVFNNNIYTDYEQLKTNADIIVKKLSAEQKAEYQKEIDSIDEMLRRISQKSYN